MTHEALYVFAVLGVTILLFMSNRLRVDLVAGLVIAALAAPGILTPAEAVAGFGNPLVLLIGGLFIVSEGLSRTGVAARIGLRIAGLTGGSETRLIMLLMPTVALLSAFMSSTGVVALFIPVALSLAREAGLSPSRLLMPVAIASLTGGMLTLIGTPPNLIVHRALVEAGHAGFGFFDFGMVGAIILLLSIIYLATLGRRWLPAPGNTAPAEGHKRLHEMAREYGIENDLYRLHVVAGSPLVGKTVSEAALRREHGVTVIALQRHNKLMSSLQPVLKETRLREGDELISVVDAANLDHARRQLGLRDSGFPHGLQRRYREKFGAAEVLLPPHSPLLGKNLLELNLRKRQRINVLALRRGDARVALDYRETTLMAGDVLLITGAWADIEKLAGPRRDMLLLQLPDEISEQSSRADRAPFAIVITLLMLVAMVFELTSNLVAVMLAALAMTLTHCIDIDETYRSMNWQSLVVIAGMLPLAQALDKSGGSAWLVSLLGQQVQQMGPYALLGGLFLLTSLLSQFISNTATTVLVAPVAVTLALNMGYAPEPFVMGVALAASTAFATPVASPVNTMILAPGRYRFTDFMRLGIPLVGVALVVCMLFIPLFFPFQPG
jgi:di/tricarboxylate transporter